MAGAISLIISLTFSGTGYSPGHEIRDTQDGRTRQDPPKATPAVGRAVGQLSDWSAFTPRTNPRHSSAEKRSIGPLGSLLSLTAMPPSGRMATSTHSLPPEPEYDDLIQVNFLFTVDPRFQEFECRTAGQCRRSYMIIAC
jgi:hypothetical protein